MKIKKGREASTTKPLLKDLVNRSKVQAQQTLAKISNVETRLIQQPDLYQDAGGGFNSKFVFPQD